MDLFYFPPKLGLEQRPWVKNGRAHTEKVTCQEARDQEHVYVN